MLLWIICSNQVLRQFWLLVSYFEAGGVM